MAVALLGRGAALNWDRLAAVVIVPIIVAFALCAAMCAPAPDDLSRIDPNDMCNCKRKETNRCART